MDLAKLYITVSSVEIQQVRHNQSSRVLLSRNGRIHNDRSYTLSDCSKYTSYS